MEVMLESPLEALIFNNYVTTFGFFTTTTVHSFWTFIAVLTAAISFWRIRAVGHSSISDHVPVINSNGSSPSSHDHHPISSQEPRDQEPVVEEEEGVVHHEVCSCTPSSSSSSSYGSAAFTQPEDERVKGNKFMVHFYQDDEDVDGVNSNDAYDQLTSRDDEEDGVVLLRVIREVMYGGYCQTNWDRVLQVRRSGDLGWYRYQDLTSLNGSVVKLWGRC